MDDVFVGRLMSAPVSSVDAKTDANEAARQMIQEDISSVAVVDDDGDLEGILTSTDFVQIAARDGATADVAVATHMSSDPVTVTANDSIVEAADLMLEHGVHHLPVVDDTEGLVGMVTTTDLTAYVSGIEVGSPPPLA
ncbi:CBS domain-containing protein [Haloarcula salina]|uniref:CBS domain-containing protein n=1 Tax=Haloarcula salina TaxID=1429914 RepID=UPI003C6F4C24